MSQQPKRGRPPSTNAKRRLGRVSFSLDPVVVEYLRSRANQVETIETAIRRTEEYGKWEKTRLRSK